jgi:hypothetical protein
MAEVVKDALRMQAANVAQKAIVDTLSTKLIRMINVLKAADSTKPTSLRAARTAALDAAAWTREEAQSVRATMEFPNEEIQQILDKAVDDITAVLLR